MADSRQITHVLDAEGVYRQVVSSDELAKVLKSEGSDLSRPKDFGPDDEWFVPSEKLVARIFEDVGGYYICDEEEEFLDTRGRGRMRPRPKRCAQQPADLTPIPTLPAAGRTGGTR